MARLAGTANLASGLQEPYLGLSPVVALTGKKPPYAQYPWNAYQEILHGSLFESVTKYNVSVDTLEQLPYLLRQALREATSGVLPLRYTWTLVEAMPEKALRKRRVTSMW